MGDRRGWEGEPTALDAPAGQKLPVPQRLHAVAAVAPEAVEKVPALHKLQFVRPVPVEKLPAMQGAQLEPMEFDGVPVQLALQPLAVTESSDDQTSRITPVVEVTGAGILPPEWRSSSMSLVLQELALVHRNIERSSQPSSVSNCEKLRVKVVAPKGAMTACMFSLLPYPPLTSRLMAPEEHGYWTAGLVELTVAELQSAIE